MKRFPLIFLTALALIVITAYAAQVHMSDSILFRLTDSIGQQYACISSSIANNYGFGGVGDTLTTDSTVSRGTLLSIRRIQQSSDEPIGDLLPALLSHRTQLDSQYQYSKWSRICWAINNHFADSGGINGVVTNRAKSESYDNRLSPKFARVARACGIYLDPKTIWPDSLNLGYLTLKTADSTITYADSNAIDSTLWGPAFTMTAGFKKGWTAKRIAGGTAGGCSIQVYGANQNLVHGRRWVVYHDHNGTTTMYFTADNTGDSLYNIDSVKIKACTGALEDTIMFWVRKPRVDSL